MEAIDGSGIRKDLTTDPNTLISTWTLTDKHGNKFGPQNNGGSSFPVTQTVIQDPNGNNITSY
jgi:hypothetical protein